METEIMRLNGNLYRMEMDEGRHEIEIYDGDRRVGKMVRYSPLSVLVGLPWFEQEVRTAISLGV